MATNAVSKGMADFRNNNDVYQLIDKNKTVIKDRMDNFVVQNATIKAKL